MVPPPLQQRQVVTPHPSEGRGEAYSQDMRELVMSVILNGDLNDPVIQRLRQQQRFPSRFSIFRWNRLLQRLGHFRACKRNGNSTATVLRGADLVLLALYRLVKPKATHAEINAFLYRTNYGNPYFRFYNHSQLSTAEKLLYMTQKRASTTAYQAFLPINILKRRRFWSLPYPHGIADIRRQDMIDLDEAGVFVDTANRKSGKSFVNIRVNEAGPYVKSEKWNLIMGVSGEDGTEAQPSRRWRMMWLDGGTTIQRVVTFVEMILADIGQGNQHRRYCFMMDNLNAHHNRAVAALIQASGHRLVFRAPYYPVDGPIEYIFNTLQAKLRVNMHDIIDGATLINEIGNAIQSMDDFSPYFVNCGFWRT